jgi:hypothetical protein
MSERWPAPTLEMRAPARLDIISCSASGITLSNVPMSDEDEIVFQAGCPEGELGGARGPLSSGEDGCFLWPDAVGEALAETRVGRVRFPAEVQIHSSVVRHGIEGTLVDAGAPLCYETAGSFAFVGHETVDVDKCLDVGVAPGGVRDKKPGSSTLLV